MVINKNRLDWGIFLNEKGTAVPLSLEEIIKNYQIPKGKSEGN
jgi:hypothetical protein